VDFQAFVYTCDLFVLFADCLRKSNCPAIQALEYKSQRSDYEQLEDFLQRYVFVEGAEITNWSFVERRSKRRILTSYLKLAFHNLMPMMRACVVFQYYEQVLLLYYCYLFLFIIHFISIIFISGTLCVPLWSVVCRQIPPTLA